MRMRISVISNAYTFEYFPPYRACIILYIMGFKTLSHSFHKSFKPVKRVSMQIYNIFRLTFDNIHLHAKHATDNILLLLGMHAANSVDDIIQILMFIVYIGT